MFESILAEVCDFLGAHRPVLEEPGNATRNANSRLAARRPEFAARVQAARTPRGRLLATHSRNVSFWYHHTCFRSPSTEQRFAKPKMNFASLNISLTILAVSLFGCTPKAQPPSTTDQDDATPTQSGVPPATSSAAAPFVDVASECGLASVHFRGDAKLFQLPQIMGSGCAWIDYDGDGDLDAYLINAGFDPKRSRNRLFRNDLGGVDGRSAARVTFSDVSTVSGCDDAGYGMGCAVGDVDADGHPDLFITNFGPNALYRNRGDGTFEDVTAAAGVADARWSASAIFADYDEDGHLDLFVTNYMDHPRVAADNCHDNEGNLEYCGPNLFFPPIRDSLYRNRGDGTFEDVTISSGIGQVTGNGLGVVSGDFNHDGRLDFYVANDASPNHLWINLDGTRFRDRGVEWGAAFNQQGDAEAGMGVQSVDVDGDQALDLFVTHLANETNTLYSGDGRGRFEDITFRTGLGRASRPLTGFGTAFFDADHDGDLDLFVTNGRIHRGAEASDADLPAPWHRYAEPDQIFEHLPSHEKGGTQVAGFGFRFAERPDWLGPAARRAHIGRGAAVGDYDADGDMDILVTACGGSVRLLRNDTPKRGNWIIVRTRGKGGGEVYGARVTVSANRQTWVRDIQPGYSYLSSNDPRVHIGVGEATAVDVEIRWPGGQVTQRQAAPVDQVLEFVWNP